MFAGFVWHDDNLNPDLESLIRKQHQEGGKLVAYRRHFAAVIITYVQTRIVWVPPGESRHWEGWPHSVFTLFLGIWSIHGLLAAPLTVFHNCMGGIDVTEYYSTTSADPLRMKPPIAGTAAREEKRAQWQLLGCLWFVLAVILYFVFVAAD